MGPTIPTKLTRSIPRPLKLIGALNVSGKSHPDIESLYENALRETVARMTATASPVFIAGEQHEYHNFCDDTSTSQETEFAKIRARVEGI